MELRRVGGSGLRVSALGLGTSSWAGTDEEDAAAQLRAFLDAGGTLVDTSPADGGASQELLGRVLAGVPRERVALCASTVPTARSRRAMLAALDADLGRLGTDHLDLWLLSGWDETVPLAETLCALDLAVTSGRVRYAGVSDTCGWQTALASARFPGAAGGYPMVACRTPYSLLDRAAEAELVPAAAALGMGLLARYPLGRAPLAGGVRGPDRVLDAVGTAADGLGLSPVQVALGWLLARPGVGCAVVAARTAGQLLTLLAAGDAALPAEIHAVLDEVSGPATGAHGPGDGGGQRAGAGPFSPSPGRSAGSSSSSSSSRSTSSSSSS